jgi:hypothetical protein
LPVQEELPCIGGFQWNDPFCYVMSSIGICDVRIKFRRQQIEQKISQAVLRIVMCVNFCILLLKRLIFCFNLSLTSVNKNCSLLFYELSFFLIGLYDEIRVCWNLNGILKPSFLWSVVIKFRLNEIC